MRFNRALVAVLVGAILAAGCAGPAPTQPAAQGSAAPSAALGKPLKIGLLEPLTGPLAQIGKDNADGTKLYFRTQNNVVANRPIEIVVADTQGQADVAVTKARDLVDNQKVDIIAGISQTPECYAVAQYVQSAKIPMIVTGNCGATYLTTDSRYSSPYVARFTSMNMTITPALGTWIATKYKTAVLFTSDFAGGLELNDLIGTAFVKAGGTVVQEIHPPANTTDFGPYLTTLKKDADVVIVFLPGADGLRFGLQYPNYLPKTVQIFDVLGQIAGPANLLQLKDTALGIVGGDIFTDALDTPQVRDFKALVAKELPGRPVTRDLVGGYAGGIVIAEALKKANGNTDDRLAFMNAVYGVSVETPRGPLKLDKFHDIIHNVYFYQIVQTPSGPGHKLLDTVTGAGQLSYFSEAQITARKFGTLKGKWVGMTKADVERLLAP